MPNPPRQLADRIDPRKNALWRSLTLPQSDLNDLIAASDALRQSSQAVEIGRGMGLREAAVKASMAYRFGDYKRDELTKDYGQPRYDLCVDIEHDILALLRSPDATGQMVDKCMEAGLAAYNGAPDSHSQNVANVVRAVLATLGIGEAR